MSMLDIAAVPVNNACDSRVARGSDARPNGTRSRSSTSGTEVRRMARAGNAWSLARSRNDLDSCPT
jgi:hypothetical protein